MPFLGQEGHVLDCWKASSSTEKGVSLKREKRDYWNILTFPICLISVSSLTEDNSFFHGGHFFFSQRAVPFLTKGCFFSHRTHRWTEHTSFHRDIKSTDITEPYSQQKPHPQPLSEWRGEWSPRLPLHVLQMLSSLSPSISRPIGVTSHTTPLSIRRGAGGWGLCELCMPKAFCGLEMCAKNLRELCALCERKNSPVWEKNSPTELLVCHLIGWVHSLSHRITQKNRTHKISQRH